MAGVILPSQGHGDLPYLVEDEFPCASCGAWVEFEFTPKAMLALTAQAMLIQAVIERGEEDRPRFVRLLSCRIGGQVMPIAVGFKLLRERVGKNAKDGMAWYQLGILYSSISRPRAALRAFEKAAGAIPTAVSTTLRQAELLADNGRSEQALKLLAMAWTRRQDWQIFGDPRTVQQQFIELYNHLRRELGRSDLPALHPASIPATRKVGRNDPCPCGSGKKFKKCCGK